MDSEELKIYCGIKDEPPKGYRFGKMSECAKQNQIRRFGLKKISKKTIENALRIPDRTIQDVRKDLVILRAKKNKIMNLLDNKNLSKSDRTSLLTEKNDIEYDIKKFLNEIKILKKNDNINTTKTTKTVKTTKTTKAPKLKKKIVDVPDNDQDILNTIKIYKINNTKKNLFTDLKKGKKMILDLTYEQLKAHNDLIKLVRNEKNKLTKNNKRVIKKAYITDNKLKKLFDAIKKNNGNLKLPPDVTIQKINPSDVTFNKNILSDVIRNKKTIPSDITINKKPVASPVSSDTKIISDLISKNQNQIDQLISLQKIKQPMPRKGIMNTALGESIMETQKKLREKQLKRLNELEEDIYDINRNKIKAEISFKRHNNLPQYKALLNLTKRAGKQMKFLEIYLNELLIEPKNDVDLSDYKKRVIKRLYKVGRLYGNKGKNKIKNLSRPSLFTVNQWNNIINSDELSTVQKPPRKGTMRGRLGISIMDTQIKLREEQLKRLNELEKEIYDINKK